MHRLIECRRKLIASEGLDEPASIETASIAKIIVARHEDDGNFSGGGIVAQAIRRFEAGHGGHHHVTKNRGRPQDARKVTSAAGVVRRENTVTAIEQQVRKHGAHFGIVFHDHQCFSGDWCDIAHHSVSARASGI